MRVTIHHHTNGDAVILQIEGKLAGLHVSELGKAWKELAPSLGEKKLLVDLRGLLHVDQAGVRLLANIHAASRADFLADTPLTKYFAEQAGSKFRTAANLIYTRRQS